MIPATSLLATYPGDTALAASIDDRTVPKTVGAAGTATASYELNSDGKVYNHNAVNLEVWRDSGVSADFEARATLTAGSALFSGTVGTWQVLSTTRTWSQQATGGVGLVSSTLLIEIRLAASPFTVLDSASIIINATSDP